MNIYLISNESYRLINKEIKKIVKNNNFEIFNMNKSSIKEILEEASYFSLDNNQKYLVVTNADVFSADKVNDTTTDSLLNYFNNPNPNTILIFTTQKPLDSRKKIVKELKSKYKIINTPKMDKKTINSLLTNYVKENDFDIDYQSVNYIVNNCYNNIIILRLFIMSRS